MGFDIIFPTKTKGSVVSGFGQRFNNAKQTYENHYGVDIGVVSGTSVLAIADGEVVQSDMTLKDTFGNFILIKHNILGTEIFSGYAHLLRRDVRVGDKVEKGQVIGLSGGNQPKDQGGGDSTGQHLHFELRNKIDGDWINPEPYLKGTVVFDEIEDKIDVISDKTKNIDFEKVKKELEEKLKDSEFKEKLAEKLNVSPDELMEKIQDKEFVKQAIYHGIDILGDNAPEIWKKTTKLWKFIEDTLASVGNNSETLKLLKAKFDKVRKDYEASDKGMWEQNEKLKKMIKKIL